MTDPSDVANAYVAMQSIESLLKNKWSSVTICSNNADFNGQPNCAIEVYDDWTNWLPKRFTGATVRDALCAAQVAREDCTNPKVEGESYMTDAERTAYLEAELKTLRAITPADRRIAEAPRAWAVQSEVHRELGCFFRFDKREALTLIQRMRVREGGPWKMYPVAIVELKEGE